MGQRKCLAKGSRGLQFLTSLLIFRILSVFASDGSDAINFPPQLDSDDIQYYSETHDIDGLHWALSNVFRRSSRNRNAGEIVYDLPPSVVSRGGGSTYTTAYKLAMDLEQVEYLAENLKDREKAKFFRDRVAPVFRKVLKNIPPLDQLELTGGLYAFRKADIEAGILEMYNKANYVTDFDELKKEGNVLSLLSDTFDAKKIEAEWFGESENSSHPPGVVVIDNLLSPAALVRIKQVFLESTVFFQTKMPLKFGGYAGAYIDGK